MRADIRRKVQKVKKSRANYSVGTRTARKLGVYVVRLASSFVIITDPPVEDGAILAARLSKIAIKILESFLLHSTLAAMSSWRRPVGVIADDDVQREASRNRRSMTKE